MIETRNFWRLCTTCRRELPFGEDYWVCSVSTCNRKKMPLTFCSIPCWDAHLPTMRHRDAWAEERRAPTRQQWEAEQASAPAAPKPRRPVQRRIVAERSAPEMASSAAAPAAPLGTNPAPEITLSDEDLPRDILIVASKLKKYIKARSGMKTSDTVLAALSDVVRKSCDEAIRSAARSERKTVLDRDVD